MRATLIRIQLVFVSVILLATFLLMMALVIRHNRRWDFTKEKIYSLSDSTRKLLEDLRDGEIEVIGFYPQDDRGREEFEIFLKECQIHHPRFRYAFYDPDRVPRLAKEMRVKELYTVLIRYNHGRERMVRPTEESFTNALLRLAKPRTINVCFVTGHGEASLDREDREGFSQFKQSLADHNYVIHEIILLRDQVPDTCQVAVLGGPHRELDPSEHQALRKSFSEGRGLLFLLDPMDPGAGESFQAFLKEFGIVLGQDVVVDKMSRLVGGDFLVPLVAQYVSEHPITAEFDMATFFPVSRSVQPTADTMDGWEIMPLAFSGSGSWAETDLNSLEKGEASLQIESDISGPISMAVASRKVNATDPSREGRIVTVGDSDFLTNAYFDLSGNEDLALNIIEWLSKEDRFIQIRPRALESKPLFLTPRERILLLSVTGAGIPVLFFLIGAARIWFRARIS